jgi:ADP-dependent NAD(P)H-hydrate dehydratase / NAD(P)H-hydrate epimerase
MTRSIYGREQVYAVTAEQAAAWDRVAQERHGIPESRLMESAAATVAAVTARLFPRGRVIAAVGSGHNGGDALLAARDLCRAGHDAAWFSAAQRVPELEVLNNHGVPRIVDEEIERELATADVIIDGILGTGSRGAPRSDAAARIEAINRSGKPVVAVDLPSGVDATSGVVPGAAINAAVTVTFGAAKTGLLLHPARGRCGRLIVSDIGFPEFDGVPDGQLITPEWAWRQLPRRTPNAHKGTSGRVLLLVGSIGMAGAAAISARAAVRAGAGLVRIASDSGNREILQVRVPEATFFDRAGELPFDGIHALVAGCGLGTDEAARAALERALEASAGLPTILDADALNLLARSAGQLQSLAQSRPLVLTPHVRELSRISGWADADILRDPIGHARNFAESTGAVVLLKGQPSVVAAPGEPVFINSVGSSDMAAGGMGDQLSGIIGALLAARAAPRAAAALALFFGGRAADLARRGRSLTPDDVSDHLYRAFRSPGLRQSTLALPFITFDQAPRW